jgi:hypothetical protein
VLFRPPIAESHKLDSWLAIKEQGVPAALQKSVTDSRTFDQDVSYLVTW